MEQIDYITRDGDIITIERYETKKEALKSVKMYLDDCNDDQDIDDLIIGYKNKDGSGGVLKKYLKELKNMSEMIIINESTIEIYGNVEITFNEHYGDWDVDFSNN